MDAQDYTDVTEMAGDEISFEQLVRLANRYYWAGEFVRDKDVLEVACGTGPGLGYLSKLSNTLVAGDYSNAMVNQVKKHYGDRIRVEQFDAQKLPFADDSLDVILIFEALYYIPSADAFVAECKRVLRPGGVVLVSNANKDLYDFNPSPHSFVYHGVTELTELFSVNGFEPNFWGSTPIAEIGLKQRLLRPIKKLVVTSGLMPKSMAGKKLLKRFVFGNPVEMPLEIDENTAERENPTALPSGKANDRFKVIYCAAKFQ